MVSSSVRSTRSRTPTRIVTPAVKAKAVTSANKKSKTPPRMTASTPKQASTSKKSKAEPKSAKRKATPKELFDIEEESPKKKQKVSKSTKKDTEKKTKATKTPKAKTSDTTDGKAKKKRVQKKDADVSITSVKSRAESPSKKSNTSLNGSLVSNTSSASLNETETGNWRLFNCTVM